LYWFKTTYIQLIILLLTLSCKAQGITIALEDKKNYEFKDGSPTKIAYAKDINNILGEYLGTWVGVNDSKSYEFRIERHTVTAWNVYDYQQDVLIIRYIIKDSSGTILEDTTNLPADDILVIGGLFMRYDENGNPESYQLDYNGRDHNCGQHGDMVIKRNGAGLDLFYFPGGDFIVNCDNTQNLVEFFPPNGGFSLTKQ